MKNENRKSIRLSYMEYLRRKKYYDSNYFIQPHFYKNDYSDIYYNFFEKTDKEKLEGESENQKSFLDIILRVIEFIEKTFHKIKNAKDSDLDSKSEIPFIINQKKSDDKELAFDLEKKTDNRFTHFPELPDYEKIHTEENLRINVIESRQWFAIGEKEKKKNKIVNAIFLTIGIFIILLFFSYLINYTPADSDVYLGIVVLIVSYTLLATSAFVFNKKHNSLFKDEANFLRSKSQNATSRNKQYLKHLFDYGKQRNEIHKCLHQREEEIFNLNNDIQRLNKKIHTNNIRYKTRIKEIKQKSDDKICDLDIQRGLTEIEARDMKEKLVMEHRSEMNNLIDEHIRERKKFIDEHLMERKKLINENKNIKLKHQKMLSNMKKEEKERMEKYKNDLIESAKKEMIKFRKDTVERVEDNIMDNVFNANNEQFNESKDISHEEYLREKRQEEEKQKRDREDLEIKKQILNMEKSILDVKSEAVDEKLAQGEKHLNHEKARAEIKLNQSEKHFQHEKARADIKLNQNEKHFQHEKARMEMQSDYNQKLSKLELSMIKSITKLDLKIETGLVKLEKSISEVKAWAEINFNTMKMWVKEEVLRIDKNHLMIVNKMEEFDIRYKGDMKEIHLHFQEFDFKIDRVAFEAHERILALDYSVKNEGLRLDKKIDNEVLRLEKSDIATEGLLANIQHNLEKGLLLTKMEQRESEYRSDIKVRDLRSDTEKGFYKSEREQRESEYRSDSKVRDLRNDTEKGFYKSEREQRESEYRSDSKMRDLRSDTEKGFNKSEREQRESEYRSGSRMRDLENSTEKSFLEAKYENERKLFVFNNKIDKQLDSLSHKHDIEIKDISHLAELKGEKLEKIIFQRASELRQQISEEKANNKVQWAKMDSKFSIQIKDMQTLHMKHLYEQDQKIMKVINKIESLHHDIAKTSVQMGSMKNDIEKVGIANDRIKQDANALLSQVSLRLDSIENSFKLAKETSRLVEERIDTKVENDLLKLKSITLDQERKLQEIAFAEQGMDMLFDKYENRAAKKEQEVKNMNDNITFLSKKIESEKKLINESGRLQDREIGMNNRMTRLIDERNDWKRDAEQSNRDANYYRKAAEHFRKKAN